MPARDSFFHAAARLGGHRNRALLHSARDDDGLGRWSFATADPDATLIAKGHSIVELDRDGRPQRRYDRDPFVAAEEFLAAHGFALAELGADRAGDDDAPPEPRVIGYLGYDLARTIEALPGGPALGNDVPDLWLAAYPAVARWRGDGRDGAPEIVGRDRDAIDRLAAALAALAAPSPPPPRFEPLTADDPPALHLARVERIRDYLAAGDVYQVNLARRLTAKLLAPGDPLAIYAALAAVAPAPYGALLEADGAIAISGSPERLLASRADGRIETRPIKGTAARSPFGDTAIDAANATATANATDDRERAALLASAKDAAEHLMIVDLERNDLGRIAVTGSVVVDALAYAVSLPALHHVVSRVSARPRPGVGIGEVLRAIWPGGSITGAPKHRATEIIDELEPARRGPYCGAIGYFGARGQFDLALAIRTGVIAARELRVHVGGGIVADSDPTAELDETEVKARGWRAALAALAR